MTSRFQLPILVYIKPSPWITVGVLLIHFGALASLLAVDLNIVVICIVLVVIITSLVQALTGFILRLYPDTPVQLILTAAGEWWLTSTGGQTFQVHLLPAGFVHPLFTVLSFHAPGGKRYSVILTPDVLDADMFRRLRARLKLQFDRIV